VVAARKGIPAPAPKSLRLPAASTISSGISLRKQKKAAPVPAAQAPVRPPTPAAKAASGNSNVGNVAAAVDQHVAASMDSLKDQIFRLELRRQAGTISEEDYAREKAQVEKLLRDLVKG